jgi:hypothetical protein
MLLVLWPRLEAATAMIAIIAITAISNVVTPPGICSQKDGGEDGGCSVVTVTVGVTIVAPFVVAATVICTVMFTW